jgi:hypothetical protein
MVQVPYIAPGQVQSSLPQQAQRVYLQCVGEPLKGSQTHVALTSFERAHVCAVHAEHHGQLLLAQPAGVPDGPQVPTQPRLQVSVHR